MDEHIVVSGIGIISPAGNNTTAFWEALCEGRRKTNKITDFNPRDFIQHISMRHLSRLTSFAVAASRLAIKEAGVIIDDDNSRLTGVVLGNTYRGWSSNTQLYQQMSEDSLKRINPFLFPSTVPNSVAGQIAIELGIKGPNTSLVTGYACATDAIGYALNYLRRHKADIIIAGGAEELTSESAEYFKGVIPGEGAAMFNMETLENNRLRSMQGCIEIAGYASTYDVETEKGAQRAVNMALEQAGVKPQEVDYINTEDNDPAKSIIGHTLGAAGAFSAAVCILAMRNNLIPVSGKMQGKDVKVSLSVSSDPSGNHACLVFRKI